MSTTSALTSLLFGLALIVFCAGTLRFYERLSRKKNHVGIIFSKHWIRWWNRVVLGAVAFLALFGIIHGVAALAV
jgi:hypothetical protein